MKTLAACGVLIVSAFLLAPGCARDSEAGRTVDCASICSKYSECTTEIDVASCTSECEDKADADSSYQESAAACTECIEDKACKEAEPCWASCPDMPAVST
ncbi:uncharacterized protein SOCE26_020750 [Sorangium cellulosum]|uniref:Secreted protein n=1 Tax=Sorangium cellulosum TaxID=56 RepID=A0A2L0EMZ1_SORCE|nr:uncharacterized protein SOCE26_020750 [Sorangium cellulosum]